MKRYRFSLDVVLRIRRSEEEASRQSLVAAERRLRDARSTLLVETERYRSRRDAEGPSEVERLRADHLDAAHAAARVAAAQEALVRAAQEAEDRRADWTERARAVAALERLDERRRREWWTEARRREEMAVDDLVTARWNTAPMRGVG